MDNENVGFTSYPRVYFELMLAAFTLIMSMSLSSAFLPIYAGNLDPSGILVGLVVSAWFFSRIFTELPFGVLSDRLGRRRLLVTGLGLAVAGAFLCSLSFSAYILILGRALWGLGTALFFMSNTALIFDLFEPSTRGRALGTFQAIEFIGSFIGAPIGGFAAQMVGYRGVFFVAFLLMLCSFSVASISKGLREVGTKTSRGPKFSAKDVLSGLQSWVLTVICINSFSRMLILQGIIGTVFPIYLNYQLGIGVELIGIILSLRTAGLIVATMASGYLSDRFGRRPMIVAGMLIQTLCLYAYMLGVTFASLLPIGFLDGFGLGMGLTSVMLLLSEVSPQKFRGGAIGLYRTFMDIGGFFGPPFFMLIFGGAGSHIAFLSAVVIFVANIVLVITTRSERKAD